MNTTPRFARTVLAGAISATLAIGSTGWSVAHAATLQWTCLGVSASWNDALNWSPQGVPADGDDLLFGTTAPRVTPLFDLVRSFSSLSFNTDSSLYVVRVLGNGAQLAFSGAGIRSEDATGGGTLRQALSAEAGSTGGTMLFTNSSGINLGNPQFARPVDIAARGGAAVGYSGGRIVFQDSSSSGGSGNPVAYTGLYAEGAGVAGASGSEIIFRDRALFTRTSGIEVRGGVSASASGGRAGFTDQVQIAGGAAAFAGLAGGLGGRIAVSGNAVALETASFYAEGGASALAGAEAVASFRGDAVLMGSAYLGPGRAAGANGGRYSHVPRSHTGSSAILQSVPSRLTEGSRFWVTKVWKAARPSSSRLKPVLGRKRQLCRCCKT